MADECGCVEHQRVQALEWEVEDAARLLTLAQPLYCELYCPAEANKAPHPGNIYAGTHEADCYAMQALAKRTRESTDVAQSRSTPLTRP